MYHLLTICFIAAATAMPAIPYNLEWTPYGLQYFKPGVSLADREKIYINDGKQVVILPSVPQTVQLNPVGPAFLEAIAEAHKIAMAQLAASNPAQNEQPAQPDQPTEFDKPVQAEESAQSEQPAQSEEITKFEEPSEQPIPAVPSLGPLGPAIMEAIAEAREAARERALAAESEEPAQSAGLAKLDESAQPEETAQPEQPAQPEKPNQPENPSKPEGSKKPIIIMVDDALHQGFNNWFPFVNSRPGLGNYLPYFPNLPNYNLQNFPNSPNYQFPNLPYFYNYQVPNIPISSKIPPLRALKSPYVIYRNRY